MIRDSRDEVLQRDVLRVTAKRQLIGLWAAGAMALLFTACGSPGPPKGYGHVEGHLKINAMKSTAGTLVISYTRHGPRPGEGYSRVRDNGDFESDAFPGTYYVVLVTHANKYLQGTPAGSTCPSTITFKKGTTVHADLRWPGTHCGGGSPHTAVS